MTPTGNPIQDQSDTAHAQAIETAAMAGWLLLYGAWQGVSGGPTRSEAEIMLRCYASALTQRQAVWDSLRDDAESDQILRDLEQCREALIQAIREPARLVPTLGLEKARSMMRHFESAAREAEREGWGLPGEINLAQRDCDDQRGEIETILSRSSDFRTLYLESESEAEGLACELSGLKRALKEAGTGIEGAHDLRCEMDSLRGEVLAAEERRDELAAFVLQLMEHLRSFRTNDMNSGLEMQHHAVIASPRSLETETISLGLLQERVEKIHKNWMAEAGTREQELLARLETSTIQMNQAKTQLNSTREVYGNYAQEADIRYQRLDERHRAMLNVSWVVMSVQVALIAALTFAPLSKFFLGL